MALSLRMFYEQTPQSNIKNVLMSHINRVWLDNHRFLSVNRILVQAKRIQEFLVFFFESCSEHVQKHSLCFIHCTSHVLCALSAFQHNVDRCLAEKSRWGDSGPPQVVQWLAELQSGSERHQIQHKQHLADHALSPEQHYDRSTENRHVYRYVLWPHTAG